MRATRFRVDPVVAPNDAGEPPGFVVACIEKGCNFAHDVHALTAEDAVQTIAATHAEGKHRMIARAVDYSTHPLYEPKGTV